MGLCGDATPAEFGNLCIRSSWASLLPICLVGWYALLYLLTFVDSGRVGNVMALIKSPFHPFVSLNEAEELLAIDEDTVEEEQKVEVKNVVPILRTIVLAFLGLAEALSWLAVGSYGVIAEPNGLWAAVRPFLIAAAWLYAVVRPIAYPAVTAPMDLFVLYCAQLSGAILLLGGRLFDHVVEGLPLPSTFAIFLLISNLTAITILVTIVFYVPLAVPSFRVKKEDIGLSVSPEDYSTLLQWTTFSWVYPLVKRGKVETLSENDVWGLSPTLQSRAIFLKFSSIQRKNLLRRLWAANSMDIIIDCVFTIVSVMFNYCNPFFMKLILAEIEHPNPASQSRAYVYAFLMFLCSIAKAESDVQHLWFGRRGATRVRSELMASIYDKALKRKDLSGITNQDKEKETSAKGKDKDKADDPRAGADIGKIVNLMAGDANRLNQIISGMYFIYGAPFEVIIASVFLYRLLGWSAFSGFLVLIAIWPLNNYLARRSVRINKGTLTAKDKRMGVLNELIGAVKFIKFFAWEDKWIDRALAAREVEMGWMIKARINSVMFFLVWTAAPIFVSVVSFWVYVMGGNALTVSTAFTAIALFAMIRQPLNVIPMWIVQLLQAGVALDRISVYLEEEEVSSQVSSLKRTLEKDNSSEELDGESEEEALGLVDATIRWNEVVEKEENNNTQKPKQRSATPEASMDNASETVLGSPEQSPVNDHNFELRDISVMFPEGQLSLVTGPTASGKTAILMALLGEMTLVKGKLVMAKDPTKLDSNGFMHTFSYAAQTPWLRHQSIQDNILFGYPYDEERYKEVIECCALKPDLAVLEDGDATEIGARGVSLSGGQKARVALARAVYARTKYVLLDDPLSAVDSHTSRTLFDKLLMGPLLAKRTVILVTHHVELVLPGAYYIVRMLDGRIDSQGTTKELKAEGLLEEIARDAEVEVHKEEQKIAKEEAAALEGSSENKSDDHKPRKLIKDEHRETGNVKWQVYKKYLKASSYIVWAFLVVCVVLSQIMSIVEKVWIMTWGEAYNQTTNAIYTSSFRSFATPEHDHETIVNVFDYGRTPLTSFGVAPAPMKINWPNANEHPLFYVGIYAAIGAVNVLISLSSPTAQYTGALRASRVLFKQLLVTVVRATFRFHDTTPQGRMLNRFGKDIDTIDSNLAASLQSVNGALASFFASVLTVAFVYPIFLLPAALIGMVYRELAIGYLNTGRDLRRMESNSRSPIFSDFGELLEGIVTVRAFGAERRFLDGLHKKIDATTKMWYNFWMTNRWLLLNFDALGALAVLITSLFSITRIDNGPGFAGLCMTSALSFTTSVYWACRFWTGLELDLNSVERVIEYLELPQEPDAVIESSRPPAYWPSSTSTSLISAENLTVKYSPELPAVLKNVNLTLKAGERVGLLGRTGSGKSTLAMSLLRFVDPTEGKILIDGIDITTIGVHDLRSRLTFIPQDATLFSGTLKDNLDPFNEHEDSECLDVLRRVEMIGGSQGGSRIASRVDTPVSSRAASIYSDDNGHLHDDAASMSTSTSATPTIMDGKTTISLETKVSAGGTNFSQGQRQLIAMARALLRHSSIIILDEATSSIDFKTDAKIQKAIREEFGGSLLVTIAHRLRTVIDYDRIVVLDKGEVAEFDTPWNLVKKEGGIFRTMCLKSGQFAELETAAREKAETTF